MSYGGSLYHCLPAEAPKKRRRELKRHMLRLPSFKNLRKLLNEKPKCAILELPALWMIAASSLMQRNVRASPEHHMGNAHPHVIYLNGVSGPVSQRRASVERLRVQRPPKEGCRFRGCTAESRIGKLMVKQGGFGSPEPVMVPSLRLPLRLSLRAIAAPREMVISRYAQRSALSYSRQNPAYRRAGIKKRRRASFLKNLAKRGSCVSRAGATPLLEGMVRGSETGRFPFHAIALLRSSPPAPPPARSRRCDRWRPA